MSQLIFYSFLVSSEENWSYKWLYFQNREVLDAEKCIGNFEILISIKIQLNISGNETQALKEYLKWLRARRPPARAKT